MFQGILFLIVVAAGASGPNVPTSLAPQDSVKTFRTDSLKTGTARDSQATQPVFLHRTDTVVVVKHQFNHREQIITGSVVMACLVGILAIMNNYNPR